MCISVGEIGELWRDGSTRKGRDGVPRPGATASRVMAAHVRVNVSTGRISASTIFGAKRGIASTSPPRTSRREIARTSCAGLQRRIERQLRNIEHRALHRAWLNNPTIEGSTLELSPHEEQRARAFLRGALGLDIEEVDRRRNCRQELSIEGVGRLISRSKAGSSMKPPVDGS